MQLHRQTSNSVLHDLKENLGVAPEWIQCQLLNESIVSIEWVLSFSHIVFTSDSLSFTKFVPYDTTHYILGRISKYADCKVTLDAPWCTGNLSIQKTLNLWEALTVGGGELGQTKTKRDEANPKTGSSFEQPVCWLTRLLTK